MRRAITFFKSSVSRSFHTAAAAPAPPQPFSNLRYAKEFCALIKTLSQTPQNPKLRASLLSSLDSALTHTHPHLLDTSTALLLLRGLALVKTLTRAKTLLSTLPTIPTPFLYSVLLQCLLPQASLPEVQTAWADLSKHHPMDISRFTLHLCRNNAATLEIETLYRRASGGLTSAAYKSIVAALCGNDRPKPSLARTVLREMEERGFVADGFAFLLLFRSFCRIGNTSEADAVLRVMVDRDIYQLDILIYGDFLYGLCRSGKFREARKLFDKMSKRRGGTSGSVLKRGRRVIFQLAPPGGISVGTAFTAYFGALCDAGKVDVAERLINEAMMTETVLDDCVYTSFVEVLFRVGRADDGIMFFEAERRRGNPAVWDIAAAVVDGLCEMGRVDDAFCLLKETVGSGFAPTARVWNHVLWSYWNGRRAEDAMRLFDEMRGPNFCGNARPDASTYAVMINGLVRNGDVGMAATLVEEAIGKKIRVNVSLHCDVARGLRKHRGTGEAQRYLSMLIEKGVLISYTAWELMFDSMIIGSGDDSFSYESALSIEDINSNSNRRGRNRRRKDCHQTLVVGQ